MTSREQRNWKILKVLTSGELAAEFKSALSVIYPELRIRSVIEATQEDVEWADCMAVFSIPEKINISQLGWIHSFNAGIDNILQRDDLHKNTRLTRTTGKLGEKAGEYCLSHILNFYQNTIAVYDDAREKCWLQRPPVSCKDKRVLILGTGRMGSAIAKTLNVLQIECIGVNTSGQLPDNSFTQCVTIDKVHELANDIDCLINTLPLNGKTSGLIDLQFFNNFKNCLFINVGRGQSLVTDDLLKAIETKCIAYAVLDVFANEPLPASSALWQHPNIFISPHQAAITDIDDIIDSFTRAYESIGTARESEVLVNFDKGY